MVSARRIDAREKSACARTHSSIFCWGLISAWVHNKAMADDKAVEEGASNSFAAVAQADAEFRAAAAAAPPADAAVEARALAALFGDAALCATCRAKLGARWQSTCLSSWQGGWKDAAEPAVGKAILDVVERLDAPHLLASGIRERMLGGHDAACFGLATLLSNMGDAAKA